MYIVHTCVHRRFSRAPGSGCEPSARCFGRQATGAIIIPLGVHRRQKMKMYLWRVFCPSVHSVHATDADGGNFRSAVDFLLPMAGPPFSMVKAMVLSYALCKFWEAKSFTNQGTFDWLQVTPGTFVSIRSD
jgi:hypothetical protein